MSSGFRKLNHPWAPALMFLGRLNALWVWEGAVRLIFFYVHLIFDRKFIL
jgi:hypothetical protein